MDQADRNQHHSVNGTPANTLHRRDIPAVIIVVSLIAFIFAYDIITPMTMDVWFLYLIPLILTIYLGWRFAPFIVAGTIAILTVLHYLIPPLTVPLPDLVFNLVFFFFVIAAMSFFIRRYNRNALATITSEEQYRSLMELSPVGIIVHQRGEVVSANAAAARILRAGNPENLVGKQITGFAGSNYRSGGSDAQESAATAGDTPLQPVKSPMKKLDGTAFLAETVSRYVVWNQKQAVQLVLRDVTESTQAENNLRMQAQILESIGEAVIATDVKGRFIYWNNAATSTFGWKPEEAMGKSALDLIVPETSHGLAKNIMESLPEVGTWSGEFPSQHRDGRVFPLKANISPVIGDKGEIIAFIGTGHDINDRKKAEEELRLRLEMVSRSEQILMQNEKRLSETLAEREVLLAEVHHRVKNNLSAFISLLSLDDSYDNSPGGKRLRSELMSRARSMSLIHETLYKTKEYATVDMDIYLTNLVEQIAGTAKPKRPVQTVVDAKGVTLDISRATPCGLIISEIVTNSFKYAFPPSFDCEKSRNEPCTIRVSLKKEDGSYLLNVGDNGVGLPEGLDAATAPSLGLKLVRFLARHQLRATVATRTGQGTMFTIRFTGGTGAGKTPAPGK